MKWQENGFEVLMVYTEKPKKCLSLKNAVLFFPRLTLLIIYSLQASVAAPVNCSTEKTPRLKSVQNCNSFSMLFCEFCYTF